jgi:hypothetical protein
VEILSWLLPGLPSLGSITYFPKASPLAAEDIQLIDVETTT